MIISKRHANHRGNSMKTWLVMMTCGSIFTAYMMTHTDGAMADTRNAILDSRAERVYAATGDAGMAFGTDSVRYHITGLRATTPTSCQAGHQLLDNEYKQNPSTTPSPVKNAEITRKINKLCNL
ncbi:MAG: hypothetical protein CL840_03390 [Crocinitomicaceae bacterium]|nr:hypothetical protein [Crocinitomicaceae bacterium]